MLQIQPLLARPNRKKVSKQRRKGEGRNATGKDIKKLHSVLLGSTPCCNGKWRRGSKQTNKQNLQTELTHSPETLLLGTFYVIKHPLLSAVKRQQVKYLPMERRIGNTYKNIIFFLKR